MVQIFFISDGYLPVRTALQGIPGQRTHGWQDDGATQIIGVVEIGSGDGEQVASALEAQGVALFPDHRFGGATLPTTIANALAIYGVNVADTTAAALIKVLAKSGFHPHRPKRFS